MSDALDDVTSDELPPDYVERRVADWAQRIDRLYAKLRSWLPPDCVAAQSRTVTMHEELMKKANIAPKVLPVLDVSRNGNVVLSIEPRGLWIVGTNGRLDVRHSNGPSLIIDKGGAFSEPKWKIARLSDRTHSAELDEEHFLALL